MTERITKSMAKILTCGGTFALLIFCLIPFDTTLEIPERSHEVNMTESLCWKPLGKNNCVGCHTLIGEGAYYAPELMNIFQRRGAAGWLY